MYLNNNDLAHYEDMFLYQGIPVFIALVCWKVWTSRALL